MKNDSPPLAASPKKRLFHGVARISNALFGPDLTNRYPVVGATVRGLGAVIAVLSPAHRRQRRFEKAHPEAPWFAPDSLPFIDSILRPHFIGFEWGAGRSTLWFAARIADLTSVESNRDWFDDVRRGLAEEGASGKVDLRLAAVHSRHDFSSEEREGYLAPIAEYPAHYFDFVLIDGLFRRECLLAALPKVKPGGYLIVDNADLPNLADIVDRLAPYRIGIFSNGIWETAVYQAPVPEGLPSPKPSTR